jgi:hypothetical protein
MKSERNREDSEQREDSQSSKRVLPRCASCDIEILWPPVVAQEKTYCCTGCAAGGPCSCDYSQYYSVTISGVIHYYGLRDRPKEA